MKMTHHAMLMGLLIVSNNVAWSAEADCNGRLNGTWQSDRDLTLGFVEQHAKVAPKHIEFWQQVSGHYIMQFNNGTVSETMPKLDIEIGGKGYEFGDTHTERQYQIIDCDHNTIALKSELGKGQEEIYLYHFQEDNVFWVYVDSIVPGDLNVREYFRRQP